MKNGRITADINHQPTTFDNALEQIAREGARNLLQQALENEVEELQARFNGL